MITDRLVHRESPGLDVSPTGLGPRPELPEGFGWVLLASGQWGIHSRPVPGTLPSVIDFCAPRLRYRCLSPKRYQDPLARALGVTASPKQKMTVLDTTAGWGVDGFFLASLGVQVTLIERNPAIFFLLQQGLSAARQLYPNWTDRIKLLLGDSRTALASWQGALPEGIYIDPMFSTSERKRAQVKKHNLFLRTLLGPQEDAVELQDLLLTAQALGSRRVVVKRPKSSAPLSAEAPSAQRPSGQCRFDIYFSGRSAQSKSEREPFLGTSGARE